MACNHPTSIVICKHIVYEDAEVTDLIVGENREPEIALCVQCANEPEPDESLLVGSCRSCAAALFSIPETMPTSGIWQVHEDMEIQ